MYSNERSSAHELLGHGFIKQVRYRYHIISHYSQVESVSGSLIDCLTHFHPSLLAEEDGQQPVESAAGSSPARHGQSHRPGAPALYLRLKSSKRQYLVVLKYTFLCYFRSKWQKQKAWVAEKKLFLVQIAF